MWLLFVTAAALVWSFANIVVGALIAKAGKKQEILRPDYHHFAIVLGIGGLLPLLGVPFVGIQLPDSISLLALTVSAGLVYFFGLLPFYVAYKHAEATLIVPLGQMGAIFTLLMSSVFLMEVLRPIHFVAFFLILAGGVLVSLKKIGKKVALSKAFWFILLTGFILGGYYTLLKYLLNFQDFKEVFIISRVGVFLGLLLILMISGSFRTALFSLPKLRRKTLALMFNNEILNLLGTAFITIAYSRFYSAALVNVSTGAIQQALTFILAFLITLLFPKFYRESFTLKILIQKGVSVALIISGLALIYL